MAIIIMGVSTCGKSTVAAALAGRLERPWIDGDSLHLPTAIEKMQHHIPLNDTDRIPWLERINQAILEDPSIIIACSALKYSYRDIIRKNAPCYFVHLEISYADAYQRITHRPDHFFPADLLHNQYETLESLRADEMGISLSALEPVAELCRQIIAKLPTDTHC